MFNSISQVNRGARFEHAVGYMPDSKTFRFAWNWIDFNVQKHTTFTDLLQICEILYKALYVAICINHDLLHDNSTSTWQDFISISNTNVTIFNPMQTSQFLCPI